MFELKDATSSPHRSISIFVRARRLADKAARVLPGGEAARFATTAPGKQEPTRLPFRQPQVVIDRLTGLLGYLEPDWAPRLPLPNGCSVEGVAVRCHVLYTDGNDVAAAQFAVDGEVEQGEVACAPIKLQLGPDRPYMAWSQGGFAAGSLPLFQGTRRDELSERGTSLSFMGPSPWLRDRPGCGEIAKPPDSTVAFGEHLPKDG